jgi:3-deoxy-alpha-D-manno-octulosonate 8-oxidase
MLLPFRNLVLVPRVMFSAGAVGQVDSLATATARGGAKVYLVDHNFARFGLSGLVPTGRSHVYPVDTTDEPTTAQVDALRNRVLADVGGVPSVVIGVGGGSTLDVAKAVSIVLTNDGGAERYQGWDLVANPAVYKIGVPTISGTGAEVSRTAVLTGPRKKQGINSDASVFDQVVLDPELLATVPPDQRFFTGMDCYIHSVEALSGTFLNAFSRGFAGKALDLCRGVFLGDAPDADLMVASLMGGVSIVYSEVGLCHALSYGLSWAYGVHHGVANCIVFDTLGEFYGEHIGEFRLMLQRAGVALPRSPLQPNDRTTLEGMIDVTLLMERPLCNALGPDWQAMLPRDRIRELYLRMAG